MTDRGVLYILCISYIYKIASRSPRRRRGEQKPARCTMDIIIRNTGEEPIYGQIVRQVKEQILRGELKEGDALPSMRLLAKDLRISVITTKRAYEELERDGFLTTVPGKGCFVAPQDRELLREEALRRVEEQLSRAVDAARAGGVGREEVEELLDLLWGDEIL